MALTLDFVHLVLGIQAPEAFMLYPLLNDNCPRWVCFSGGQKDPPHVLGTWLLVGDGGLRTELLMNGGAATAVTCGKLS